MSEEEAGGGECSSILMIAALCSGGRRSVRSLALSLLSVVLL